MKKEERGTRRGFTLRSLLTSPSPWAGYKDEASGAFPFALFLSAVFRETEREKNRKPD